MLLTSILSLFSNIITAHILAIVIAAVSRSIKIHSHWQAMGESLGVKKPDLDMIDSSYDDNESKCREMLILWNQTNHSQAAQLLIKHIHNMGYNHVAGK